MKLIKIHEFFVETTDKCNAITARNIALQLILNRNSLNINICTKK